MPTIVADLGNLRLKWGRAGRDGRLLETVALSLEDRDDWDKVYEAWELGAASSWWISTVNPPLAERLRVFLEERGVRETRWYRSAADVPLRHELDEATTAGADRALGVLGTLRRLPVGVAGLLVSCGTAITVERISAEGVWQGGAIALGLGMSARALHLLTAQLPCVEPGSAPPAWGRATRPALEAGVFWGVVGAVRELLARQAADLAPDPRVLWTGGEAPRIAPSIAGSAAEIVPDLVLHGLTRLATVPSPRED